MSIPSNFPPPDFSEVSGASASNWTSQGVNKACTNLVEDMVQIYNFFNPDNDSSNSWLGQILALQKAMTQPAISGSTISNAVTALQNSLSEYLGTSTSPGIMGNLVKSYLYISDAERYSGDPSLFQNLPYGITSKDMENIYMSLIGLQRIQNSPQHSAFLYTPPNNPEYANNFPGNFLSAINAQLDLIQKDASASPPAANLPAMEKLDDIQSEALNSSTQPLGFWVYKIENLMADIPNPPSN